MSAAHPAPPCQRPRFWELTLGAALVLLFCWRLAFTNQILARGDTFLYFYPLWDYRAAALLAGRLPLWTPELFMGAPFLANSQTGVLYPLNWPLAVFPAPTAAKIAIVTHLVIASLGAQQFARRRLGLSPWGGLLAATLFALGGYVTAQVEHLNQLQALAWFPWQILTAAPRFSRRRAVTLSALTALQILAGHTQTVFIALSGLSLYSLGLAWPRRRADWPTAAGAWLLALVPAVTLAAGLAAAQLLPTLELSRESLRSGGLAWREALSFSLDPRLLGRALLPGYSRSLFSEFVAYAGVVGLGLAPFGLRRARRPLALAGLGLVGLAFALGAFNPLSAALAAFPPFNLFRVPARWLFLFAFALAMLAGLGLDGVNTAPTRRRLWLFGPPLILVVLTPLASALTPAGESGPLGAPSVGDLAGWLLALTGTAGLVWSRRPRWQAPGLVSLAVVELFLAAQALPFNHLTAPEAYTSVRPAMTQLLAARRAPVADRFVSMSALRFDPGDLAELRGALAPQVPEAAVYDFVVATKHKELLSPNLALTWGLPSVDGFDGGVLPLRRYATFTALFTGTPSADGRLRENLVTTPDPRLLGLVNARWLITDKVGDAWREGVFYDLQFTLTLKAGESADLARVPAFEATGLGVVAEGALGRVRVEAADGSTLERPLEGARVDFGRPLTPARITLSGPATVHGLSLIDARTGAFQSLTLGPFRLAHSGDVKVYELLTVRPRAFLVPAAQLVDDEAAAQAALADPAFDPAQVVLIHTPLPAGAAVPVEIGTAPAPVEIEVYTPERVQMRAAGPGWLMLTDAFYPGWTVTVDGQPAALLRADIAFRAVPLPAGAHTVVFEFRPASVAAGLAVSASALIVWLALALWRPPANKNRPGAP